MKKASVILILLLLIGSLTACTGRPYPTLEDLRDPNIGGIALNGYSRESLRKHYGEPDDCDTSPYGAAMEYYYSDGMGGSIAFCYNDSGKLVSVMAETLLEAEVISTDEGLLVDAGDLCDRCSVGFRSGDAEFVSALKPGDRIRIGYDGLVQETYPCGIYAFFGMEKIS